MKLLLLTPQRPYPPHQGTTLRNFNLIKELAQRHPVAVLTFLDPDQNPQDPGPLATWCTGLETIPVPKRSFIHRLRHLLTTRHPDMSGRLWSPAFNARLAARLRQESFDLIQIEGLEMAPYLPTLRALSPSTPIIYDAHNAEWILQQRAYQTDIHTPRRWAAAVYSWIQWHRLRHYEAQLLQQVNHTIAMSDADKAALTEVAPHASITVVPNGVDLAWYAQFTGQPISFDLVFSGKMDFRPNIDAVLWFTQEVWPFIIAQRPHTTLAIVGQRPHARLDILRSQPNITLTGFVDDVRPYIAGATVYIAPLRVGGGTRLKLMEAMAMRKAIVSTTVGAEGFPVVNGQELILADTPAEFAQAVLHLLATPTRRVELGQRGYQLAYDHYSWSHLVPQLEEVYHTVSVNKR